MKKEMMEFSFRKMGIENRIKRSRNPWLLNFDFGDFLKWMDPSMCRAFLLHFGMVLV